MGGYRKIGTGILLLGAATFAPVIPQDADFQFAYQLKPDVYERRSDVPKWEDPEGNGVMSIAVFADKHGKRVDVVIPDTTYEAMGKEGGFSKNPKRADLVSIAEALAPKAEAAIGFVAAARTDNSASSVTYALDVGSGSNRILFIGCALTSSTVSAVTYNGVAATNINTQAFSSGETELWYSVNPTSGSNNVVCTAAAGTPDIFSAAAAYTGASQTGVPDNHATATAASSVTSTIVSVADNSWHVAYFQNDGNNFSAGTNLTIRTTISNYAIGDRNAAITPAGSSSITANNTTTSKANGATFAPAADAVIDSSYIIIFE